MSYTVEDLIRALEEMDPSGTSKGSSTTYMAI